MTNTLPVTFFYNHQQVKFEPDMSFMVPEVGQLINVGKRMFKVKERRFMGLIKGKRSVFINLEENI